MKSREKKELSDSMEKAFADLTKEVMIRLPGGYWGWAGWSIVGGTYYNANTIQALVERGQAEYVEFVRGFNGRKPIKVKATPKKVALVVSEPGQSTS